MAKEIPYQGKDREFGKFAKTQRKHSELCLNRETLRSGGGGGGGNRENTWNLKFSM